MGARTVVTALAAVGLVGTLSSAVRAQATAPIHALFGRPEGRTFSSSRRHTRFVLEVT